MFPVCMIHIKHRWVTITCEWYCLNLMWPCVVKLVTLRQIYQSTTPLIMQRIIKTLPSFAVSFGAVANVGLLLGKTMEMALRNSSRHKIVSNNVRIPRVFSPTLTAWSMTCKMQNVQSVCWILYWDQTFNLLLSGNFRVKIHRIRMYMAI